MNDIMVFAGPNNEDKKKEKADVFYSKSTIIRKDEAQAQLINLLNEEFFLTDKIAADLFEKIIKPHFSRLVDSCYFVTETNYIDKVYRDSYYSYYSTKANHNKKNCIRISIFDGEVAPEYFKDKTFHDELQKKYRGFIVLRPTIPHIIGRSIISPKALKINNFLCESAIYKTTAKSIKLDIEAFPHSSQDTETMTCAETMIWTIMEYFSARYPEYKPVLPSQIIKTLSHMSPERQIPSRGLLVTQISFALKEFGFGSRIYSRTEFVNDFEMLLSCYVESGIPIVIAIDNLGAQGNICHVVLCVGHEKIEDKQIDSLAPITFAENELVQWYRNNFVYIYDYNDVKENYVFIDDNLPAYQRASLDCPGINYGSEPWLKCRINHFIVPLYPKIYLEAFVARRFVLNFLAFGPVPLLPYSQILLRLFLTSTRSFKDKITTNPEIQDHVRILILSAVMPKFIWIAELSTKELIKTRMANGLIILDATEPNIYQNKPLLFAAYQNSIIYFDENHCELVIKDFNLHKFSTFENNLKNC